MSAPRNNAPTEELRFNGRVDLAALRFNPGAPHRALALHGWLDNAMSFAGLAAALPQLEIVALDFAGHGRSGHLPEGGWYHFVDYLDDVLAALDGLEAPIDLLLGHSLGGAVATACAAAYPERVPRLALIEALGPLAGDPALATQALRQGLQQRRAIADKRLRVFTAAEQAVAARLQANPMAAHSAAALIARGLRPAGEGFVWASDPRLTVSVPTRLAEPAIRSWITAIRAPTLLVVADQPPPYFNAELQQQRLACLAQASLRVLPGHHHLHMDDPAPVAQALAEFLAATRTVAEPAP